MITGNISQFSLPEIFEMIDSGTKSGLLSLTTETKKNYYIWFKEGKIIAAANRLDCNRLLSLLQRRSWIDQNKLSECLPQEKLTAPLGDFLQKQGILKAHDLQQLFNLQVLREVTPLFQLKNAHFKLYENVVAPMAELTGITITVKELLLKSLRILPNWETLQEKLPYHNSTLSGKRINSNSVNICLDLQEEKVWEFTKENLTINKIAEKLNLEIEKVQQIAFRLIVIGFAEEIPVVVASNSASENTVNINWNRAVEKSDETSDSKNLSLSYFNNVISFFGNSQWQQAA
jgi:hypothetical protein